MPIRIRNITPKFTGKVRIGVTQLSPEFLSSTMLTTVHETMPVDATVLVNQPDVTFSAVGVLPTGFSINPSTGRVSAARTAVVPAAGATVDVGVRATNAKGLSTQRTFQVRVEGSAEGDLYDFPVGHTLDPTYLPVTSELLAAQYPRLVAKFGSKIVNRTGKLLGMTAGSQLFSVKGPRGEAAQAFGTDTNTTSISDSNDGSLLFVSSVYDNSYSGVTWSGNVQVFSRTGNNYSLLTVIQPETPVLEDRFGTTLTVSPSGNTVAVASVKSLYVFERSGNSYVQKFKLDATSVGMTAGGNFATGLLAMEDTVLCAFQNNAIIQVKRSNAVWSRASNIVSTGGSNQFNGRVMCFSGSQQKLFVGDYAYSNNTGAVFEFKLVDNVFVQTDVIRPTNLPANAYFGFGVSSDFEGNRLAVSSLGDNRAFYVLSKTSTWQTELKTTNVNSGKAGFNTAGSALFFSYDRTAIVAWTRTNNTWTQSVNMTTGGSDRGYVYLSNDGSRVYYAVTVSPQNGISTSDHVRVYSANYEALSSTLINLPANTVGKLTAVKIQPNRTPTWNTLAGSLGSFVNTAAISVQLNAVDPDGAVQYSLVSGSLPAGVTLSPTGLISGTSTVTADTTASFTVRATGDAADSVDRAFTLVITMPAPAATELFAINAAPGGAVVNGIDLAGKGGLVWMKQRTSSADHYLWDTVRGRSKFLKSNSAVAEGTYNGISFNSNGFNQDTMGGGDPYAWTFRKAPKFFDVVTWTGNDSYQEISHSLGVAPGMIIAKNVTSTGDWMVFHKDLGRNKYLNLNTTGSAVSKNLSWGDYEPSSTKFIANTYGNINTASQRYVAYVFAHDPSTSGVIQCGINVGNGATSSAAINLGWAPRFLLTRSSNNVDSWAMLDTVRGIASPGADKYLYAQAAGTENQSDVVDLTATGFAFKNSLNASGVNQIYMAIR